MPSRRWPASLGWPAALVLVIAAVLVARSRPDPLVRYGESVALGIRGLAGESLSPRPFEHAGASLECRDGLEVEGRRVVGPPPVSLAFCEVTYLPNGLLEVVIRQANGRGLEVRR